MQELIFQLKRTENDLEKNGLTNTAYLYREIIKYIETLLEKEKEQIIDAHNNAVISPYTELYVHKIQGKSPITKGEDYYNQKYNQNISNKI